MKRFANWFAVISASVAALCLGWFWLLPNDQNPRTLGQAVQHLLDELQAEDLQRIADTPTSDDLIEFHFSHGTHIRNELGLWRGNLRLVLSIGKKEGLHPDGASHLILIALWETLNASRTENHDPRGAASQPPAS
jgi:hypothetical protein